MIYFRYGEEDFQIKRACQQQEKELLKQSSSITVHNFNAQDLNSDELTNLISSQSLFGTKKIVVINNLFSAKNQSLENYLFQELSTDHLVKQTDLFLLINDNQVRLKYQFGKNQPTLMGFDGRFKNLTKKQQSLFDLLNQLASQSEYYPKLKGASAESFLNQLIKERELSFNKEAQQLLLTLSNYNFWQIHHELNKINHYQLATNPQQPVDQSTIILLVNDTNQYLFDLIEAITNQKLNKAIELLEKTLNHDELIVIIALLNRQALQFLKIKANLEEKLSINKIEQLLGLPHFISQKLINQASLLNLNRLINLVNNLTKLDWSNKTSRDNLLSLTTLLIVSHSQ